MQILLRHGSSARGTSLTVSVKGLELGLRITNDVVKWKRRRVYRLLGLSATQG
jgi:hypothetical protein